MIILKKREEEVQPILEADPLIITEEALTIEEGGEQAIETEEITTETQTLEAIGTMNKATGIQGIVDGIKTTRTMRILKTGTATGTTKMEVAIVGIATLGREEDGRKTLMRVEAGIKIQQVEVTTIKRNLQGHGALQIRTGMIRKTIQIDMAAIGKISLIRPSIIHSKMIPPAMTIRIRGLTEEATGMKVVKTGVEMAKSSRKTQKKARAGVLVAIQKDGSQALTTAHLHSPIETTNLGVIQNIVEEEEKAEAEEEATIQATIKKQTMREAQVKFLS